MKVRGVVEQPTYYILFQPELCEVKACIMFLYSCEGLYRVPYSICITILCRDPVLCLQHLARGLALLQPQAVEVVTILSTFSVLFSLYLNTLHDAEFYREKEGQCMCSNAWP